MNIAKAAINRMLSTQRLQPEYLHTIESGVTTGYIHIPFTELKLKRQVVDNFRSFARPRNLKILVLSVGHKFPQKTFILIYSLEGVRL